MTQANQGNIEFKPGRSSRGRREAAPTRQMEELFSRVPPFSVPAEMSLLGSLLLDPKMVGEILPLVPSGDSFYREEHAAIFDAIVKLYDKHQTGDLVQLAEALADSEVLKEVGGDEYLLELARSVPSSVNAPHYARIVREKAQLRKLIVAAGQIIYDAYHVGEMEGDAQAVLDKAEQAIFDIAEEATHGDVEHLHQLLQQMMDMLAANEGRAVTGLETGYYDLSEITSGFQNGELVIVAARPSMGKTALALNLAEQVAMRGDHNQPAPVAFFSMEMSKQALTQRLICARAGIDSHRMRTNRLSRNDFQSVISACSDLSELPIFIDDTPGLSIMMLRAKARRMAAQHGIKCIFIDYLQLMSAPSVAREGRQQEVSTISRGVKALARELNIPVVCLAQLNRGAEQREGHRPRMADLRESGSIEQDADVILLLHREEYYHQTDPEWLEENEDKVGLAELIVAKQRNGPTGTVKLTWDNSTTRFKNWAGYHGDDGYRAAPSAERAPRTDGGSAGRQHFAPGKQSGPVDAFRDGGGPDDEPFEDEPNDSGLPPF